MTKTEDLIKQDPRSVGRHVGENKTGALGTRRLMRLTEVEARVRIKRTAIYRNMKSGKPPFPQPIKMQGASFWIESEIEAYLEYLMSARAGGPARGALSSPAASTPNDVPTSKRRIVTRAGRNAATKPLAATPSSADNSAHAIRVMDDMQRSIMALAKVLLGIKADLAALRKHLGCGT